MGDLKRPILALALAAFLLVVSISEGSSDSREIVQASEILTKTEGGEPVEYDVVIIEGDLDLSRLDLPTEHVEKMEFEIKELGLPKEAKVAKSHIAIMNSAIRGEVNFSNIIFQESVDF